MCPHMYQGQGWSPVYTKPQHKKDNKNPTHPFSSSPAPLTHVKLIIVSWMRRATHVWPRMNQGWSRQVDMVGCVGTQVNMDQIIWYGGYGNILVCHKLVKYAFCRCSAGTKVTLKSQMFVCLRLCNLYTFKLVFIWGFPLHVSSACLFNFLLIQLLKYFLRSMKQGLQHQLKMPPYKDLTAYMREEIMPRIHLILDGPVVIGVQHSLKDMLVKSIERLLLVVPFPPGDYQLTITVGAGKYPVTTTFFPICFHHSLKMSFKSCWANVFLLF